MSFCNCNVQNFEKSSVIKQHQGPNIRGNNLAAALTDTHDVIVLNHIASDRAKVHELRSSKRKSIFSLWLFSCCSFCVYIFAHVLLQTRIDA